MSMFTKSLFESPRGISHERTLSRPVTKVLL